MWSRLERWAAFAALAACFFLASAGSIAQSIGTSQLSLDTYTIGTITLGRQSYQAYRLLFADGSPFASGKIVGMLLLQKPGAGWQAFVSFRERGCYALSQIEKLSPQIGNRLTQIQPIAGPWLPDNPTHFRSILQDNSSAFGALVEGQDRLPSPADTQASLAKLVLPDCDSPEYGDADRIEALLQSSDSDDAYVDGSIARQADAQDQAALDSAQPRPSQPTIADAQQAAGHATAADEYHKRAETALTAIRAEVDRLNAATDAEETAKKAVEQAAAEAQKARDAANAAQNATDTTVAADEATKAETAAKIARQAAEKATEAQSSLAVRPLDDSSASADLMQQLNAAQNRIQALELTERTLRAQLASDPPPPLREAILPVQDDPVLQQLLPKLRAAEEGRRALAEVSNQNWLELQERLSSIAWPEDRKALLAWVDRTKPTLIDPATPVLPEGGSGKADQSILRQGLADVATQIERIKAASARNWKDFKDQVPDIQNQRDRTDLRSWIDETEAAGVPEAFGPVNERTVEPPGNPLDWLAHLDPIPSILLLLLLASFASLWVLWQLKRTQDQIPHRLASDPTFKRTLQESVAPDQIRRDLEAKFKPMQDAASKMQDAASKWLGHFLDKRSELFDEPMKLALGEMAEWSTYQPVRVPPAKQQHTGTADKLAHRGPARGNGPAANETGDEPKALSKLAGELVKNIEDRKKKLEVALGAANQTGAQPELTPASRRGSLVEEAAWIVKGQEIALPLAKAFRDLTETQATLLQRARSEMERRDNAIQGLETSNGNLHQQLEKAHESSNRYRSFALGRLMETGFLGAAEQAPDDETLAKAMERFDNDIEHFPEHLDYASRLIALRSYLSEDRVRTLPYYGTAGLAELREKLDIRKSDWQSLFHGEEQKIAEALVGQWNGILRHLFRSRLLLQAYWPERTDPDLAFRLERAHAAVEVVLHKHAIHPHPAQLLRPLAEVERPPKIIADDSRPLPPALADSPELNDAMNRLQYEQNTKVVVDVAYWGVDCKVSVPEETTRTLLITRSVRGGTSQS
jgi:hypothetical protein